jgi:putative intracellular protease/amidase
MAPKKILIILSDANAFTFTKTQGKQSGQEVEKPTGYFLTEVAKPLKQLLDSGYEVTFASPHGKKSHPDPKSESILAFAGDFYERRVERELIERMKRDNGLDHPRSFKSINNAELDTFAGVFIPGGHGPLADLGADPELGRILKHFHSKSKPTAALCHGPYAFLSTKYSGDKEFAYKGYKLTSWSDVEEHLVEKLLAGEIKKTEGSLRDEGAVMVEGSREKVGYITVDKEVVSGGNPMAATTLGSHFVKMLSGRA